MSLSKYINGICIITGGIIAFYANADEQQNTPLLITGICLLMIGLYNISKTIPSKKDEENDNEQQI